MSAHVVDNNYVSVLVDKLRDFSTSSSEFSKITNLISEILLYEAVKNEYFVLEKVPHWSGKEYSAKKIKEEKIVFVPILRAGIGMLDGARKIFNNAHVHALGLYRNEESLQPVYYYNKMPESMKGSIVFVLDPMLATGGSVCAAIKELKKRGVNDIRVISIIGAPEGLKKIESEHSDVKIFLAALDLKLNNSGYIIPGLGDAGDRIFNT